MRRDDSQVCPSSFAFRTAFSFSKSHAQTSLSVEAVNNCPSSDVQIALIVSFPCLPSCRREFFRVFHLSRVVNRSLLKLHAMIRTRKYDRSCLRNREILDCVDRCRGRRHDLRWKLCQHIFLPSHMLGLCSRRCNTTEEIDWTWTDRGEGKILRPN